jgi:hypothetical protein
VPVAPSIPELVPDSDSDTDSDYEEIFRPDRSDLHDDERASPPVDELVEEEREILSEHAQQQQQQQQQPSRSSSSQSIKQLLALPSVALSKGRGGANRAFRQLNMQIRQAIALQTQP